MEQMYFVYTLSHGGNVFYIGCSKNASKRYSMHLNSKRDCPLNRHIKSILEAGELPIMNIITYKQRSEAHSIEETLIKCMSTGGQRLFNSQHVRDEQNVKAAETRRKAVKNIKERERYFFDCIKNYKSYYSPWIFQMKRK